MTARLADRPSSTVGSVPRAGGARRQVLALLLGTALAITTVVAGWGLQQALAPHGAAEGQSRVLNVPGGEIHVGVEQPDVMAHTVMPGMAIPDPLPEGELRFRVAVTLVGLSGDGIAYSTSSFAVSGPDLAPTRPKSVGAQSGVVPPGMTATIVLLFQVPKGAGDLAISFDGGTSSVALGDALLEGAAAGKEEGHGEADDGHADR